MMPSNNRQAGVLLNSFLARMLAGIIPWSIRVVSAHSEIVKPSCLPPTART